MSRYGLCRVCAGVAVLGGGLVIFLRVFLSGMLMLDPFPSEIVLALASLMWAVVAILLVLGLVGAYALPERRSWVALTGLLLTGLSSLPVVAYDLALSYYSVAGNPDRFDQTDTIPPEYAAWGVGLLLFASGILLLGGALAVTRVLGPWLLLLFVLPLLSASPVLLLSTYFGLPPTPFMLTTALQLIEGVCWVLLGFAVWRRALRQEPTPVS